MDADPPVYGVKIACRFTAPAPTCQQLYDFMTYTTHSARPAIVGAIAAPAAAHTYRGTNRSRKLEDVDRFWLKADSRY